jgi:hypothetical protein
MERMSWFVWISWVSLCVLFDVVEEHFQPPWTNWLTAQCAGDGAVDREGDCWRWGVLLLLLTRWLATAEFLLHPFRPAHLTAERTQVICCVTEHWPEKFLAMAEILFFVVSFRRGN